METPTRWWLRQEELTARVSQFITLDPEISSWLGPPHPPGCWYIQENSLSQERRWNPVWNWRVRCHQQLGGVLTPVIGPGLKTGSGSMCSYQASTERGPVPAFSRGRDGALCLNILLRPRQQLEKIILIILCKILWCISSFLKDDFAREAHFTFRHTYNITWDS